MAMLDADHFDHYSKAKAIAQNAADITGDIIDVFSDGSYAAFGSTLAKQKHDSGMHVVATVRP